MNIRYIQRYGYGHRRYCRRVGGILASLAYPIYNVIVKAKRKKLAPEIIRLTDELMK